MVKALGGSAVEKSGDIAITAPDIAENGAVVPIAGCQQDRRHAVDRDPRREKPVRAVSTVRHSAGTEANVGTRVKMGQSSNVHAVVKANGKYYVATKGSQSNARRLRRLIDNRLQRRDAALSARWCAWEHGALDALPDGASRGCQAPKVRGERTWQIRCAFAHN